MEASYTLYCRVSTEKQGKSGLGLEAQQTAAKEFVSRNGGIIIKTFIEIESGKNNDRPILAEAIKYCRETDTTLLIAKLDRLSRNVGFIFSLRDSGVKFVACDLPEFSTITLAVFAASAQHEREMTSKRTKDALAEKKSQGAKLGASNEKWKANKNNKPFDDDQRAASVIVRRENAKNNPCNLRAWTLVRNIKGLSWSVLASMLNEGGFTTAKGGKWSAVQVQRLVKLYEQ